MKRGDQPVLIRQLGRSTSLVIVILLLGALALWWRYQRLHQDQLLFGQHAKDVQTHIQHHLLGTEAYLQLVGSDLARGELNASEFQTRVSQYVAAHPELVNVTWADSDFIIRWTAPFEPNKQVVGLKLELPEPKRASRLAAASRQPVYTQPFVIIQGKIAFEVYVPVFRGETFLGTLGGVYSVAKLLPHTAPAGFSDQYQLSLVSTANRLLTPLSQRQVPDTKRVQQLALAPPGNGIHLRVIPYREPARLFGGSFLFISLALVAMLGWTVWTAYRYLKQQNQTEIALRASEQRFRDLIEGSIQGILIHRGKTALFANQSYVALFGYDDPEEVMNVEDASVLIAPQDRERVVAYGLARLNGQDAPTSYEYQGQRRDGSLIWVETQARLIDWSGAPAVQMTVFDITDRKRAQIALQQDRDNLEQEVEGRTASLNTIHAIADTLYRPLPLSALATRTVEMICEYLPSTALALFMVDHDADVLQLLAAQGFTDDVVSRSSSLPLDNSLTGRAIQEKRVLESRELGQDARTNVPVRNLLITHGFKHAISVPLLFQDQAVGAMNLLFTIYQPLTQVESNTLLSIGKTVALALANAQYVSQIEAEISEHQKTEVQLLQSQSELIAKTESLTMINNIADTLYRPLDLNTLAAQAVDAISAYVPAASVALFTLESDSPWLYNLAASGFPEDMVHEIARLPRDGSLAGISVTRQAVLTSTDVLADTRFDPQIQKRVMRYGYQTVIAIPLLFQDQALGALNLLFRKDYPLSDSDRDTFLAVGKAIGLALANAHYLDQIEIEVETREQAEAAAQQAERLASLGTFAAGIAHELNNPLYAITSTAEYARDALRKAQGLKILDECCADILADATRCTDIVKRVLNFARQGRGDKSLKELHPILQTTYHLTLRYAEQHGVNLTLSLADADPHILANEEDLELAIANLLRNAVEATPEGGLVTLQTDVVADRIQIRIQDNGIGLSSEDVDHVFEPFYTTRQRIGGTGLGLSITHRIITDHDGTIEIESAPSQGTTFDVNLPLAPSKVIPSG